MYVCLLGFTEDMKKNLSVALRFLEVLVHYLINYHNNF